MAKIGECESVGGLGGDHFHFWIFRSTYPPRGVLVPSLNVQNTYKIYQDILNHLFYVLGTKTGVRGGDQGTKEHVSSI